MTPGAPAICDGHVFHRRLSPAVHEFRYPVSYVWLDPDAPGDLCRHHPLWSATRRAPVHFRAGDYGDGSSRPLGDQVRDQLHLATGHRPDGQIRMLTQMRRWGWLFNPITLYVAWNADDEQPVGVVLEVTNTPWKERHRYAVELVASASGSSMLTARVPKVLHVSPFLDERYDYLVRLVGDESSITLGIDVVRPAEIDPVLTTALSLDRSPASRHALGRALWHPVLPTHRVSFGIHRQAAKLWQLGVQVVPHPARRGNQR
jgi:hypothetical protein